MFGVKMGFWKPFGVKIVNLKRSRDKNVNLAAGG